MYIITYCPLIYRVYTPVLYSYCYNSLYQKLFFKSLLYADEILINKFWKKLVFKLNLHAPLIYALCEHDSDILRISTSFLDTDSVLAELNFQ